MSSVIPSDSPLTDVQRTFLKVFFRSGGSDAAESAAFMLAGGTALAGFYLRHRYSDDIDLFTYEKAAVRRSFRLVEESIARSGLSLVSVRGQPGIDDAVFLEVTGDPDRRHPIKKIDIIVDTPPKAGPPEIFDDVRVMGIKDIATAKLCAIGREAIKDFVDLYFLGTEGGIDLMSLWPAAKEKEIGLDEFYTAEHLNKVDNMRGVGEYLEGYMIKRVTHDDLGYFCRRLARDLVNLYPPPASDR